MKSKLFISKHKALALLGAFLFLLLSVPNVNAQEDRTKDKLEDMPPETNTCLNAMIGVALDYVILKYDLDPRKDPDLATIKADCSCLLKEFPKLSGCSDISNNKLVKVKTDRDGSFKLAPVYNSTETKDKEDRGGADDGIVSNDMGASDKKVKPTADRVKPAADRVAHDEKVRQAADMDRPSADKVKPAADRDRQDEGPNVAASAFNSSDAIKTANFVRVHIEPLGGKTNCRVFSENNKYIIHSSTKPDTKNSILPPSEVAVSNDGDQKAARWDFVLIDDEDMKKGFYILTREKQPRALFRNGTQLDLKVFKHLDGKARALASWNFMVNGKDIEGNTRYVFRPQDSKSHVLGLDERTGTLLMVPTSVRATFTATAQSRSAVETNRLPAPKFPIFWKVESIF